MISVKDDLIKVDRLLARVLRRECNKLSREYLSRHPLCRCGFKIGEETEGVPVQEIYLTIAHGIAQYLKAVAGTVYRPKIEKYIDDMEAVGEKRFARPLRELLLLGSGVKEKTGPEELKKLGRLLNRNLIKRINQALGGEIKLLERNLEQLYENLVGRSFTVKQLQDIFNDWLMEKQGLNGKTYIKITTGRKEERGVQSQENSADNLQGVLEKHLKEYYPELLRYYDRAGEEGFSLLLALFYWKENYRLNLKEISDDTLPETNVSELAEDINMATVCDFWSEVEGKLMERLKNNIERMLRQNNLMEQLIKLLPLGDLEDIIFILERESISLGLLKELIVLFVKRTESSLGGRGLEQLLDRIKRASTKTENEDKFNCLELLKNYLQLQSVIFREREGESPDDTGGWVSFYRNILSLLDYSLSRFDELVVRTGLDSRLPVQALVKRAELVRKKYLSEFYRFAKNNIFTIREEPAGYLPEDGNKLEMPPDYLDLATLYLEKYPLMLRQLKSQRDYCILMDGMRYDTWVLIKEELSKALTFRIIKDGVLFSSYPSNTENQIERLYDSGFKGEIVAPEEFTYKEKERDIVKFSYIDDKVHTSLEDYSEFMKEILFQTRNRLLPFIQELPRHSTILILSDHGYRINYRFRERDKYENPRYLHGGKSPEEIIVPWALLYKL